MALARIHDFRSSLRFPGGHSWDYCDRHAQEAIAFHVKNLKLK